MSKIFADRIVNMLLVYVLGIQKNHLIKAVLLSTNNICFGL